MLCFAGFASTISPAAHQQAYVLQAKIYQKTTQQLTYSVTAAIAGLLGGPVICAPLARVFGKTALFFWCLLGGVACQIWAACMTRPTDYYPFVVSRLFAGIFASTPTVLGPRFALDVFFLHQRGRAFTSYELSFLLGVTASPTLGGFIVQSRPWPYVFWWTLGPLCAAIVLVFFFLEETGFTRDPAATVRFPEKPQGYIKERIATLLPGTKVVPKISAREFVGYPAMGGKACAD